MRCKHENVIIRRHYLGATTWNTDDGTIPDFGLCSSDCDPTGEWSFTCFSCEKTFKFKRHNMPKWAKRYADGVEDI